MRTKKRILIIEDDEIVIKLLHILLEKEGFELIIAKDGNEAIKKIKTVNPDLILTDIMLPYKSGIEVISFAKKNNKEIPIIVISSLGRVEKTIEEALRMGVSDIIAKPFVVAELMSKIKFVIGSESTVVKSNK